MAMSPPPSFKASLGLSLLVPISLVMTTLLAGCGGDDPAPFNGITGVAATGSAIVGGTVDVACAGGAPLSAATDANGNWSVSFSGQTLPCKVKVSGGNLTNGVTYHSVALQTGTVNITPLTDIVVASLAQGVPSDWFSDPNFSQITQSAVETAVSTLKTALNLQSLSNVNPLTTAFIASTSDPVDQVLEALASAGPSHAALINAAASSSLTNYLSSYVAAIQSAINSISSSSSSSSGSGVPVSCDFNKFYDPVDAAKWARSPTTTEFAKYVKTYNGGVYSPSGSAAGTATLAANGTLTMNGVSYQATSICYDTQVGSSGNTLYVHFNGGKADMWELDSTFAGVLD